MPPNDFSMLLQELRVANASEKAEEAASLHAAELAKLRAYTPYVPGSAAAAGLPTMAKALPVDFIDMKPPVTVLTLEGATGQPEVMRPGFARLLADLDTVAKALPMPPARTAAQERIDLQSERRGQVVQATAKLKALVGAGRLSAFEASRYEARIHALAERV